jgi:hypothetical protein
MSELLIKVGGRAVAADATTAALWSGDVAGPARWRVVGSRDAAVGGEQWGMAVAGETLGLVVHRGAVVVRAEQVVVGVRRVVARPSGLEVYVTDPATRRAVLDAFHAAADA